MKEFAQRNTVLKLCHAVSWLTVRLATDAGVFKIYVRCLYAVVPLKKLIARRKISALNRALEKACA